MELGPVVAGVRAGAADCTAAALAGQPALLSTAAAALLDSLTQLRASVPDQAAETGAELCKQVQTPLHLLI